MKYIFKNIKSFAKNYTKIFWLLIITIAASTVIIHLSYGLFREYKDRKEFSRSGTNQITLLLRSSYGQAADSTSASEGVMMQPGDLAFQTYEKKSNVQDVTVADMKQFCKGVNREIEDKLLNIHTGILQGDYRFETDFLISDGEMVNSTEYGPDSLYNFSVVSYQTQNIFEYGRYFTNQEPELFTVVYTYAKSTIFTFTTTLNILIYQ